jgi:hypothetical protein
MQTNPNDSFHEKSRADRKEADHISVSTGVEPPRLERAGSTDVRAPHPATRGANSDPLGVGPANRRPAGRRCRKCLKTAPSYEFLCREDRKVPPGSPIRYWCGDCLVKAGHKRPATLAAVRRKHAQAFAAAEERRIQAQRQRRAQQVHDEACTLLRRAEVDAVFAAAITRAAAELRSAA